MNKILCFVFLIVLVAYGCDKVNPTDEPPLEIQSGTVDQPYLIKTKQDLMQMRDRVNNENINYCNKVYKLMADIDFTGEPNWVPIGTSASVTFKGIFDGNEKVIKNIQIGTSSSAVSIQYAGLFGYIDGGEVKNLGVQWRSLNTTSSSHVCSTGGIIGSLIGGTTSDALILKIII